MPSKSSESLSEICSLMTASPSQLDAVTRAEAKRFQKAVVKSLAKTQRRMDRVAGECTVHVAQGWPSEVMESSPLGPLLRAAATAHKKSDRKGAIDGLIRHVSTQFESSGKLRACAVVVLMALIARYADRFDPEELVTVMQRLRQLDVDQMAEDVADQCDHSQQHWWTLLIRGEIAIGRFVLLELFDPEILAPDVSLVGAQIDEATDTDGIPSAKIARDISSWVAVTTRIAMWGKSFRFVWGDRSTQARWKRLVRRAAMMLTPAGFVTTKTSELGPGDVAVVETALALAGIAKTSAPSRFVANLCAAQRSTKKAASKKRKSAAGFSHQSDWGETALMRSGIGPAADVMRVNWDSSDVDVNLVAGDRPLIADRWHSSITVGGQIQTGPCEWSCTCWFEDDDAVFLELEAAGDGIRRVRHVLLSVPDQFAVFTESVLADELDAILTLSSEMTAAHGVTAIQDPVTREWSQEPPGRYVRFIPAWLDDDRVNSTTGEFSVQDNRINMTAQGVGGVTVPLVVDWHPERGCQPADWTRLTVTEDRHIVRGSAAGFRVRIGHFQLLIYRSLKRPESLRAVLGQHTARETIYGHVQNSGTVSPVVVVDSEL